MKEKIKILIVEDEAIAAITMQGILTKWGHEVCEPVATGEAAIKSVEKEQPDLVLMDIRLVGEMDGLETARQIRSFSDVSIVFMTGYADDELKEQTKELKSIAYLLKPIKIYELEAVIDTILKKT